ncbi:MAG: AAA family ATPase [Vulcanimicrobiota bacterium]
MKVEQKVREFEEKLNLIIDEISKIIVGQKQVVREAVTCLIAGGNILLEGVPGLGKTLLVRTMGQVLDLKFSRIQFTPDLMPADITGTFLVVDEMGKKKFEFQKGPLFSNLVLADEINRATPKTQSALLEAMQEQSVTVGGKGFTLASPFMVLATQNPIEMEGTYPLPEAQLDRFFFKTKVSFPAFEDLGVILDRTTGLEPPEVKNVVSDVKILEMQKLSREVLMSQLIKNYISRLTLATHPESNMGSETGKHYIRFGASPRAAQALALAGKVNALLEGRFNVAFEDIEQVFLSAFRHRVILNFEAQAEGIETDEILDKILQEVPHEAAKTAVG